MRTLKDLDVNGKKVLLRVDFNVPLNAQREVVDDRRMRASLSTIRYLIERGAAVILLSHLGRPGGHPKPELSMQHILPNLSGLLGQRVLFLEECRGRKAVDAAESLKHGDVLLCENMRFYPEEEADDAAFAKELAGMADLFVDDAFGTAHRAHASTVGITRFLPSCAGFLMEREVRELSAVMHNPQRPLAVVLGGAKVSSKIGLLERFLRKCDNLMLGGMLANTVMYARGVSIGSSFIEQDVLSDVKKLELTSPKLHLPVDVVVSRDVSGNAPVYTRGVAGIEKGELILDIGPDTQELFAKIIGGAQTVFWNGPLGVFEVPAFARGSERIARAIAESSAYSVIGGGEAAAVVENLGLSDKMGYISTGGGAMLEFLAGKELPGIAVLENTS